MATKTFEELKQLAIQIRDEKTNKQNTATRIGTQMLEHLDKLEQDYYDKTATDEELQARDEKLTELEKYTTGIDYEQTLSSSNVNSYLQIPFEIKQGENIRISFDASKITNLSFAIVYLYKGSEYKSLDTIYDSSVFEFKADKDYDSIKFQVTQSQVSDEKANWNVLLYKDGSIEDKVKQNTEDIQQNANDIDRIDKYKIGIDYEQTLSSSSVDSYLPTSFKIKQGENIRISFDASKITNLSFAAVYLYTGDEYKSLGTIRDSGVFEFKADKDYDSIKFQVTQSQISEGTANWNVLLYKDGSIEDRVNKLEKINWGGTLILGDSYSQLGNYVNELGKLVNLGYLVNLGVSSASLKDNYQDRETYPYTSRPTSSNTGNNKNTFACQIEKLKRLMLGTDLDKGETKIYTEETQYPNVVLIEGGTNDSPDSQEEVARYKEQIYTFKNGYYKEYSQLKQGNVVKITDIESIDRTIFAGAMVYLWRTLHDLFPNALIFFITPCGLSSMSGPQLNYLEKGEQIKKAAALFSVPVIDWGINGRVNVITNTLPGSGTEDDPYNTTAAGEYSRDSLHPNDKGGKLLASVIAEKVNEQFKYIFVE